MCLPTSASPARWQKRPACFRLQAVCGLTRCTLGFYAGFIMGCCEVLEYILYISSMNFSLGKMLASRWPTLDANQPLVWLVATLVAMTLLSVRGKLFWRFNFALELLLVIQVAVYCVGSIPYLTKFGGGPDHAFVGGFSQWFAAFPSAMWF
ncbi:Aste57867_15616 [Aphanomyces stellatus]|uniref:Aste57867_15616 protein n=1 Tax=Aphanomyces stellatus TaxID=120398 RepID=A0A485L5E8_9STRA|nr:hypothetical protein As57867_015560 [Aphanomyces stellatus]VFT92415.1 Aste57867_15616 [Aphanomyces stellatus]